MQAYEDNHPKFLRRGSSRVIVVFRAFSLTEVVICAAILAVLGGIAAPRLAEANARARVRSAADVTAATIERAATLAESGARSRRVRFTDEGVIEIESSTDIAPGRVDVGAEPWRSKIVGANFGGDSELMINGFGESDSSGFLYVRSGGMECRVEWNPSTRRCVIQGPNSASESTP